MEEHLQRTINRTVSWNGVGVHTGETVEMTVEPAPPGAGIVFETAGKRVRADASSIAQSERNTTLSGDGVTIHTVEHVLAALWGMGVDNALVRVSAPEPPAMDGSAMPFVEKIEEAGLKIQHEKRLFIKIDQPVYLFDPGADTGMIAVPYPSFRVTYVLDYTHPLIGSQCFEAEMTPANFAAKIAPARTFVLEGEVQELIAKGLARGGSPDNAVVFHENRTSSRLRFENEPARHKMLDIVGDFALLGKRLKGHVIAERTGHAHNHAFVKEIIARCGHKREI
ncbi:MAG: UDP-3-O-acyl-N-acetylglucosamine deacetylase [bacterium]